MRRLNAANRWGAVSIALHWLSALAVFGLFALGLWMTGLTYYDRWYHDAPYFHKSLGALLFIATAVRLGWRLAMGHPAEITGHTPWERRVARLVHAALYLLLFGVMVSGYFITTADGRPLEVFGRFAVPATLSGIDGQEDIAGVVHLVLAVSLVVLALLHAAASAKHHFIDHDRTLLRMLGR